MKQIGLIHYGMGNLQSVVNALEYLGKTVTIVSRPEELDRCGLFVLPGVGSFAEGMRRLEDQGLASELRQQVLQKKKFLLGICLGMQLLADQGTEGGVTQGLGFIPGAVIRFDDQSLRIPHIGWNNIDVLRENPILPDSAAADFYFVHSYYFSAAHQADVIASCRYGIDFPAVIGRGNIFGVQFHPEKSHFQGLSLLRRFLEIAC